jgi:hypothetical protein
MGKQKVYEKKFAILEDSVPQSREKSLGLYQYRENAQ